MEELLATWYGKLSAFLSAVAVLWGGAKAFGALRKWIANQYEAHKERRDAPQKMLEALEQMKKDQEIRDAGLQKQIEELNGRMECMEKSLIDVQKGLRNNSDQIATMQNEKLNWAYCHYGRDHNPISLQTKCSLEQMYRDYHTNQKRNHIPDDWEEKIDSAPIA